MNQLTLGKKFLQFMQDNELKSYMRTNEKYYYLPYKSVKKNIRVYIFAHILDDINTLKIGFRTSIAKDRIKIDEIREIFLDLNAKLAIGALGVEKNTDIVEYSINYTIEADEDIELERYNRIISFCMNLYYDFDG